MNKQNNGGRTMNLLDSVYTVYKMKWLMLLFGEKVHLIYSYTKNKLQAIQNVLAMKE